MEKYIAGDIQRMPNAPYDTHYVTLHMLITRYCNTCLIGKWLLDLCVGKLLDSAFTIFSC